MEDQDDIYLLTPIKKGRLKRPFCCHINRGLPKYYSALAGSEAGASAGAAASGTTSGVGVASGTGVGAGVSTTGAAVSTGAVSFFEQPLNKAVATINDAMI